MEEDIKHIEELLTRINQREYGMYISKKDNKIIENLLTRYKQLEEENKNMTKEYLVNNPGMAKYLNENYIFKSKVEEKIEELENQRDKVKIFKNIDEYDRCVGKIEVLQELLREE